MSHSTLKIKPDNLSGQTGARIIDKHSNQQLKKVFVFFFIFAPKAILFSRPSGIDCAKVRHEIRTEKSFSKLFFNFGPYIVGAPF